MGLREAGRIQLSRSGKALEIVYERAAFNQYFYVPLEAAREVVEGKRPYAKMSLLAHDPS